MVSTIREFSHLKIPLESILKATNNFADENIIGKGDFGYVYKGQIIHCGESINIAARRLYRRHGQGEVEFWTEISVLSSLDNDNIVKLIGYVDEKDEKIIINRDYAKGSLMKYVSDPTLLTWGQRLLISTQIGRAINYIHHTLDPQYYIIHRNINSFTILLDDDYNPKLSGFEFSIKHPVERRNQIYLCHEAIGTRGYKDPADLKHGGVTHKSDIYSFGVVLFELLCGRKANDKDDNQLLASLAKFHYENGTLQNIIHPDLWNRMDPDSFKCFSEAAYSCLEEDRTQRPNVEQVLDKLLDALYPSEDGCITNDEMDDDEEEDNEQYDDKHPFRKVHNNLEHLRISFNNIQLATDNFSQKYMIESPTDDYVLYKVELECFDKEYFSSIEWTNNGELPKRRYTVKIKDIPFADDDVDIVYNEIDILSNCKHPNIETLLGFCKKGQRMILVYEYVSTRCLSNYLERDNFTWEKRLKICLHIAHALNYLHHEMECQKSVIHSHLNSDNIALNDDWEAKIIGFGYSIYLPLNEDDDPLYSNTITHNFDYYMDPEAVETGKLKRESDIYSFGAIMFEILCGMCGQSEWLGLNKLVRVWLDEGIIDRKVAPILKGGNGENKFMLNKGPNKESLDTFINIASHCYAEKQNQRPTMKIIIKELEKALSFQENNKDIFKMSLEDIKLATQDFNCDNIIGGGGFGSVYKGEVTKKDGNGHYTIVVKKLDTSHGQGEKQFYNEMQILYEYKHENIIDLLGYSNETDEKIIVYEHAPKGSLDKYLSDVGFSWKNRLKVCIDLATGLNFLHGGGHGQEVVIHRDIKASNILLFDDWKAKVGDFGLSMISTINKQTNYIIDHACGTKGYLDPLYLKSGFLTLESDIYSLGVVLFEILSGRTTTSIHKYKGQFIPSFIKHVFNEGKQSELVFHALKDEIVPESLTIFQSIAYQCLDDDREKRSTSKEVLAQLKKAMKF